jgi:hypothetical protein
MQVVACIVDPLCDKFKFHIANLLPHDEPPPLHARSGGRPAMMAPVIIVGAMLMFVLWDTTEPK